MFPIGPDVCGVGGVGKCPGCVTNFSNTNGSSPDSATFIIKLTTFNVPVAGFSLGGITIGGSSASDSVNAALYSSASTQIGSTVSGNLAGSVSFDLSGIRSFAGPCRD